MCSSDGNPSLVSPSADRMRRALIYLTVTENSASMSTICCNLLFEGVGDVVIFFSSNNQVAVSRPGYGTRFTGGEVKKNFQVPCLGSIWKCAPGLYHVGHITSTTAHTPQDILVCTLLLQTDRQTKKTDRSELESVLSS